MRRCLLITFALAAVVASAVAVAACTGDDKDGGPSGQTTTTSNDSDGGVPTFPHTTAGPETPPAVDQEPETTDSGLQIIDIREGSGEEAQNGKYLILHYTGWLADGSKFDSSRDRDQPFALTLGASQVIRGWEEGLAGMKEGGERRLIIPATLAYGPDGATDRAGNVIIPPNETITFDVQLIDVQDVP